MRTADKERFERGVPVAEVDVGRFPVRGGRGVTEFTLIELMVVVTIIVILASLLLPALKATRETARQTSCINGLKQMHLTMSGYVDDNNGYACMAYGPMPANPYPGWNLADWATVLVYLGYLRFPYPQGIYTSGKDAPLLHCPSSDGAPDIPSYIYPLSYAINQLWWCNYRFDAIPRPSETFIFCDHVNYALFTDWNVGVIQHNVNIFVSSSARIRHRGGSNWVFVDGHAQSHMVPFALDDPTLLPIGFEVNGKWPGW